MIPAGHLRDGDYVFCRDGDERILSNATPFLSGDCDCFQVVFDPDVLTDRSLAT